MPSSNTTTALINARAHDCNNPGFDYDTPSADYWLAAISGVPAGLSSDMLRYPTMHHTHGMTRYHYRGMLVGSAFRYTAAGSPFNPVNLWKLWDRFKIEESEMIGWWQDVEQGRGAVPVTLSGKDFLATAYVQHGKQALIAIADFSADLADYTSTLTLSCNWTALGLSASSAKLHVPSLPPFQTENVGVFAVGHAFNISATQGGLLVIVADGAADFAMD